MRDKIRVSVSDRVGVRVNTFYQQHAKARIPAGPHFTHKLYTSDAMLLLSGWRTPVCIEHSDALRASISSAYTLE